MFIMFIIFLRHAALKYPLCWLYAPNCFKFLSTVARFLTLLTRGDGNNRRYAKSYANRTKRDVVLRRDETLHAVFTFYYEASPEDICICEGEISVREKRWRIREA